MTGDPHARGPVAQGGAPLARARLAMILVHGRGGGARDMLALAERLALPDVACVAPEAAGNSWWPQSFLAPITANEPWLSSGLAERWCTEAGSVRVPLLGTPIRRFEPRPAWRP